MLRQRGLVLVSPPASEPVSLAEAKAHCNVDFDADDSLMAGYISAARSLVESQWDRQLVTATWRVTSPLFPWYEWRLPRGPLQSIAAVQYVDTAGATQTLDPSRYGVDTTSDPGMLFPAFGTYWPVSRLQPGAVSVQYVSGYGIASAVPAAAKQAIKMLVAHWYKLREPVTEGQLAPVPFAVDALLMSLWPGGI